MSCRFRPCIDLHQGKVKQIVGGTLRDEGPGPRENFVSDRGPAEFARMFREDDLRGGHVIKLGPGNDEAAREALAAWPGGLQVGGAINVDNAPAWLEAGASHVIVTSWLFEAGRRLSMERVEALCGEVGPGRVVIDLSCRRHGDGWHVVTDRWQTRTDLEVTAATFEMLAPFCAEFLIHAADVEGLCRGIDVELVTLLGEWAGRPITYAGGVASMEDLETIERLGRGAVDVTVGSALDIFGGSTVAYRDLVAWSRRD